eukprot:TRINITY_DN10608_c0_g1_i1.p1 TRINITY_DN10608_c0_g1~~TRINITY_DN10608_c0_g1_i1.p1  ORF type:complete len:301 (+),score=93.80 TRINITY_DN10608_c0_g1_i1:72-905(+)
MSLARAACVLSLLAASAAGARKRGGGSGSGVRKLGSMQDVVMMTKREQVSLIAVSAKGDTKARKALEHVQKELGENPGIAFGHAEDTPQLRARYELEPADIPAFIAVTIFDEDGVRKGGKKHKTVMRPAGVVPSKDALVRFAFGSCLPPIVEPLKNSGPDEGARARLGFQVPFPKLVAVLRKGKGSERFELLRQVVTALVKPRRGQLQGVVYDEAEGGEQAEGLLAQLGADPSDELIFIGSARERTAAFQGQVSQEAVAKWLEKAMQPGEDEDEDGK